MKSSFVNILLWCAVASVLVGCDQSPTLSPQQRLVANQERTATLNALYLEVEGLGGVPLPKKPPLSMDVPPGTQVSINLEEGFKIPEDIVLTLRLGKPEPIELGEQIVITEDTAGVVCDVKHSTDIDPAGLLTSGGIHWSSNFRVFPESTLGEVFEDWTVTIDRRNNRYSRVYLETILETSDDAWLEPDVAGLSIRVRLSELGVEPTEEPSRYSNGFFPWRTRPTNIRHDHIQIRDSSMQMSDEGIRATCLFDVDHSRGRICRLELYGSYKYLIDSPSSDLEIRVRETGFDSNLRIPDWTTPILRFTPEHPGGVPITPEELKQLEQPAASGQPAALAPVTQDASP